MEILSFKGYQGSVETAIADGVVHGKILFISDLITYEAQTLQELKQAFEEAVTDYISTCRSIGKNAEKPTTGQFNVRVGPDRHQRAVLRSLKDNVTLNAVVTAALDAYLKEPLVVLNHTHKHEYTVNVTMPNQQSAWATPSSAVKFIDLHQPSYGNH